MMIATRFPMAPHYIKVLDAPAFPCYTGKAGAAKCGITREKPGRLPTQNEDVEWPSSIAVSVENMLEIPMMS